MKMTNEHLYKWSSATALPFQEQLTEATSKVNEPRGMSAYCQERSEQIVALKIRVTCQWCKWEPLHFMLVIVSKTQKTCTAGTNIMYYQRVLSTDIWPNWIGFSKLIRADQTNVDRLKYYKPNIIGGRELNQEPMRPRTCTHHLRWKSNREGQVCWWDQHFCYASLILHIPCINW